MSNSQSASTNFNSSAKSSSKRSADSGSDSTIAKRDSENTSMMESFDIDDALEQVQGYVKTATDFAKRRPVLVLSAAVAVGMLGAWALSARAKKAV